MTTDATVPPTSFTAALRAAGSHERIVAILGEVVAASAARPAFASAAAFTPVGEVVPLAAGAARPHLLCVPAFMPGSGAIQFAWLAQAFRGARGVSVVPLPGFARGERLPATLRAAAEATARAVQAAAGGEPFALVGYSGGGIVAHAVAHALERAGVEVGGLVLLDTFAADDAATPRLISAVIGELVRQPAGASLVDDDQLAAAGAYIRLFRDWQPAPLRTPSLLLRAAERLPQLADADPAPAGALAAAERVVPGSHFTIVARNAGTTAAAIDGWLAELTAEAAA